MPGGPCLVTGPSIRVSRSKIKIELWKETRRDYGETKIDDEGNYKTMDGNDGHIALPTHHNVEQKK
jgi:hypothetical protein